MEFTPPTNTDCQHILMQNFRQQVQHMSQAQAQDFLVKLYAHHLYGEQARRSLTPGWNEQPITLDELRDLVE